MSRRLSQNYIRKVIREEHLRKIIREEKSRLSFLLFEQEDPMALAVLGAPAGGKSFTMGKISSIANDARVSKTIESGVTLTVDKLRDEFQSKDPSEQLAGFVHSFYLMKDKAKEDPKEFGKWFKDIQSLWADKFAKLIPDVKISVTDDDLTFDGSPAIKSIDKLKDVDAKEVIDKLDKYSDYKRVVRYFQSAKQEDAVQKKMNVSYDEAGDEPAKIVNNMKNLHGKGYVTDVFLIHPENVASNLIQNFYRVVTGGDGGRDSSGSIVQAYKDIEKNKDIYSDNAEETVKVSSKNLEKSAPAIQKAKVSDDDEMGDKPIDVFVQVEPLPPDEAFKTFNGKFKDEQEKDLFKAFLKYATQSLDLPSNAKDTISKMVSDIDNKKAMEIFKKAHETGKYEFAHGGVSEKFLKKAAQSLGVKTESFKSKDEIILERWQLLAGIIKD